MYEYTIISLICSMNYKILVTFEPYIFWRQHCRSLQWKQLNGIQGFKEGIIWDLENFIQHKMVWFWTLWTVLYHSSFILSYSYIVLCCDRHSPRSKITDKAGHIKELKDQGHDRPIKWSELDDGLLIVDEQLTHFY